MRAFPTAVVGGCRDVDARCCAACFIHLAPTFFLCKLPLSFIYYYNNYYYYYYFLVNGYGTLHMSEADFELELKKRSNLKSHGDSLRARKLRAGETTILKCLVWLWMCAGARSFHVRSSLVSSPPKT